MSIYKSELLVYWTHSGTELEANGKLKNSLEEMECNNPKIKKVKIFDSKVSSENTNLFVADIQIEMEGKDSEEVKQSLKEVFKNPLITKVDIAVGTCLKY